jgi:hypothetical protein
MARPAHEAGRRRSTTEFSTSPPAFVMGTGRVEDRRGVDPPSPQSGDRLWTAGRDPLTGVGPTMEGTSGAAERALLRGRAGEAALSCKSPRQRVPGRADARASGQRGGFVPGGRVDSRRRRRLRAADRHEPATGGVRADRVGAKRSPRAVAVDGAIERSNTSSLRRPLTRETSTGRFTQVDAAIRSPNHSPKGGAGEVAKAHAPRGLGAQASSWLVSGVKAPGVIHESGGKLHQRATAGVVLRSSGDRGRARGSHRLQKSTGGARPLSPMCEERVDNEGWSSPGARERCGVKERRKPARPRQSGGYGGGLSTYRKWRARKRSPGSTCRSKAFWAESSRSF